MRLRPLAVTALGCVLLAGCGPARSAPPDQVAARGTVVPNGELGKTGPEVAEDAAEALESSGAATMRGTLTSPSGTQTVDLHVQEGDLTGTVVTDGRRIEVIRSDGTAYLKAPAAFWTDRGLPEATAQRLDDRWVSGDDSAVDRLTPVSLTWLAGELRHPTGTTFEDAVHPGKVDEGPLTGRPVVVVTAADGSTLRVAATGSAYPLEIEDPGGLSGTLTLEAFSETSPIATPSDAVRLSSLR